MLHGHTLYVSMGMCSVENGLRSIRLITVCVRTGQRDLCLVNRTREANKH